MYQSRTRAAAKAKASKQQILEQIRKLRVLELEESRKYATASDLGRPKNRTQDCILCSIDRSFQQIFQHLENASSALKEMNLPESQYTSSSSISDIVAQEIVPPCCYSENGKHSSDYSISSESSNNNSTLSYLQYSHSEETGSVELTHKAPCSATESRKITPMALLQVMNSMGMITDSRSEVTDSVGKTKDKTNLSQPSNQAETVSIPPQSSNPVASPQHQTRKSKSMSSRPIQVRDISNTAPVVLFNIVDSRGLINELCSHVTGIASKPQHQVMESVGVDTLHKHQAGEPAKVSLEPHCMVFKAGERISQPQHKVLETLNMDSGSKNQATKQIRFTPSSLQPPQSPSKVLDSSKMIPEPSLKSIKINSMVEGSPMGVIPPLQASLIAQSVAQAKESLELPSASQVQVRDSIGMTPHQGTENLSLTPKPPHQVMDPSEFTPWHQDVDCSEVSPRQSHKMTEPMELTSDTWPQWKNPTERTPSHHQITESTTTAPGAPDQGTVPTGMSQQHQLTQSEVMPATPKLQEVECLEKNITPQPKVMESVKLTPELQNEYSKNLVPDPRLQAIKPVDISKDLIPEMVKNELLTPTMVSTDLGPEQQQQSIQSEELTPKPQLQTEKPVPSAPESQFPDVTVEPQLQNVQSAELTPNPQVQNNKSVNLTADSQSQCVEGIHSAVPQEVQEDIEIVALTPRLPLEDIKSANLVQKTSSEKIAEVPLLEDTKIPLPDSRSLIPESLVESMKVGELTTHLYEVKSSEVSLNSSYSFPEPEGLTENQQASEARVTSDTCHQVEESAELTQSSVGMTPAPLSQTSESMEMSLPPLPDILETRSHVVKEMKETPELQTEIKDILNLLPELEAPTINPEVMTPEPQPPDVDFAHVTLKPCSEVTNPSEISLYEYTESTEMTLPEVDDSQGTTVETYSEMGSQGLNLEPRVQIEESESLVEKLKIEELTSEPSVLVVKPIDLTAGPIPHFIDVIPGPQVHNIKSTQIDTGLELKSELSVDLVQQPSIGMIDPENTKPEPGLQSLLPKESVEGTQVPNVKSMDLNLGQEQPIVKSGLTAGPQLQKVRFPKLYQGLHIQEENPANSISGPPHYGLKSDEAISYSPMPEIRSSGFIPGPKVPEPQPHVKSMEVNLGPCLQDVRFSDPIPKPKLQGFKYTQFVPGFPLQERTSQGLMPELLLPLRREPKLEDRKLALPIQGSEFHSMKFAAQASELQHSRVISEEVNTGPWEQDTKFSELASRPKLQGVKFGEQISGSMYVSGSSMTPELGIQDPNLAKITPGLQDTRQVSYNSGPCLQDVKFWDGIPGTQPQHVKTSELNSGPHLECVKIFELTTQPENQGMKPELIVHESLFQDVKYVTGNQVPNFEDKMSYKTVSEPQELTLETMKLAPGRHLTNVDHSDLIRKPQTQGIAFSELIEGQLLGHIKPVEKKRVSKQEALTSVELTPGPHLGDIKLTKLRSKSELEHVKSMLSTPGMQAGDRNLEGLPPGSSLKGLKPKFLPSEPTMEDRKSVILTVEECLKRIKSTVVSPSGSLRGDLKSVKLIPGSRIQDVKNKGLAHGTHAQDVNAMDLKLEPKKQGESPVTFVPSMLFQDKSIEVFQGPRLQGIKPKELSSQTQLQDRKPVIAPCLKQQSLKPLTVAITQGIQEVKCVDFTSTQHCQGMALMDLTPKSRQDDQVTVKPLEWKGGIFDQQKKQLESENTLSMVSAQEPIPAYMKPIEINPKLKFKDTTSLELGPEPVVQSVKSEEFQNELQVPSMKPCQLTPESQIDQEKTMESTLDPQLQGTETMALNTQPQIVDTKTIQWIPISEFQSEKGVGSNSMSQTRDARPTELKPPMLRRGVRSSELTARSKIQGEKSVAFHVEPQLQGVKTSPLAVGLQEPNTVHFTSESQPRGITSEELNKEPKAESVRSVQWIPLKEYQGVMFLGSNSKSPFQGVKWPEQKPSIKLGGGKPSEMSQEPKCQGKKSGGFNFRPQEQCVKMLQLLPGTEGQKGGNLASCSEPQSQCVETVSLHHGAELENTKSLLGLQPKGITSTELKPSVQGRDVKTSEESMTRPKTEGKAPSNSAQECLSHRFKTIDKSELPWGNPKCGPTLRSMINSTKSMTFKPRFHVEDRRCPKLTPGIQSQESKPLKSSPGIQQLQDVTTSVLKQESQSSEAKSGVLGQGSQSQNTNIGLKSEKSSGLALQTKLQGIKSEMKSEPQGQSAKCSDLTPETKSRNMKFKLSPRSPLKSKPISTRIRRVKLDAKPGPQSQGIKLDSVLKTKPQEMEMEDCESGPQLQDLKSLRTIMGVKVQDVKSMSFSPRPHVEGMPSEVITEKNVLGMKPVEIKLSQNLQSETPVVTPRKLLLGTQSIGLDSGFNLQDLKYPELIMGMKLQGIDSMERHLTSIKPSEVVTQTNSQDLKTVDFDSGPQTQNKKPQGPKLQTLESIPETKSQPGKSVTLNSGPEGTKLQDGRSTEVNSGPHLLGVKLSEGISEDTVQKEKPTALMYQPLGQDVESFKCIFSNALDGQHLQFMVPSEIQDRKLFKLKPELHLQDIKSEVFNPGLKLEDVKTESTNLQTTKDEEVNYDADLQVVGVTELVTPIYNVPSGLKAENQKQDGKPHKLSQKQQLQHMKSAVFNHEPYLQHIKSSDLCTKLQDLKSMEFNSEQQLQDVKSSQLGLGTGTQSLGFNPGPQLPKIEPSVVSTEVKLLKESPLEFKHEPELQCRKSCDWSHSKNVMAPNTGIQDVESSELHPSPELQGIKSMVFCPGSHLEDVNSACTSNINSQYVNFIRYIPGPYLQDMNSSVCIPEPNTQCINSECNPGIHLDGTNSSSCFSGSKLQYLDSTGSNPESHLQDINSTECTPEPSPQCAESATCTTRSNPQCADSSECTPENPELHLQAVNSSVYTVEQNPLCENSNRYNLGPLFQDTNFSSFPPPQILCVNPVWCNTRINLKDINSSACTLSQESQSVNSIGYNPGVHLQAPKLQEQQLKDLKSELSPGSNNLGISPSQDVNSSNLMLGAKFQKIPVLKNQLGSQQQSIQPIFTLRPQSNGVNSVVLPTSPPEDRKFPEKSTQTPFCTNAVKLTPGCSLNDLRSKVFSKEPFCQNIQAVQMKPASQSQSVSSSDEQMIVLAPQSTRKLLAGPERTSVRFSNLSLKSQQENKKSLAFASEPKWQGVKQVKLSSVSLPETGKSVELPPKSILQNVKLENLMPQTVHPVTKSMRPEEQVEDFAERGTKSRCQVPKSVNFTSPIFQDVGSLKMTKGLGHKSPEMTEESMIPTDTKQTDNILESLEMPLKLDLQVPESQSDQDSKSSNSNLQKSYQIPEPPELHSWSWPQCQDFKKLQTKEVTESDRMTLNFKNHVADVIELTCEAREQGKEFLRMTPKPLGVGSKKRSQREQSVTKTRPFFSVLDSGITPGPGPQTPKSKNLASMVWRHKESSELSDKHGQVVENRDSVELTFGTQQSGGVAPKLTKPQTLSLENVSTTPTESLDEVINVVGISLKPRDQVTESVKTQLSVSHLVALPKVCESVEVIPGPPLQVTKSVMIPESIPQKSKYNDLTPRTRDVISSEFAPSLWLQNVQSKKLIIEPKHQVLQTKQHSGFQIIKTGLIPKPLIQILQSEEVAPGPCPQAVEPIGLATRLSIRVKECLNLQPRLHLQDLVKPMELTPRADIQVTSAELISQQTSPLKEPTVLTHEQRLQAGKSLGLKTESSKVMKIEDSNQGLVCQNKDSEMITSAKLEAENYLSRFIHSPSIPFLSIVDRTTELGNIQGSGVPEVSRAFGMENLGVDILQSSKSYTDNTMKKSSVLPLVLQNLPSDKTGDSKGTPYPEIWSMNVLSKESEKEKMEEFQRYSSFSFRILSEEFQAGLGARRSSIRSFLGIQQNVWESHVCRQRLPRKYLSNMLMLGNVLGTTMERKPCSQSFSIEGSTMDSCQSIENLFGVPAELMEFSQSLLERVPRTTSQTSVDKKYIQRHILLHSNEKRMPLKMWTRGSTSSIIQRFSGTRLGIKKTCSKLSDIFQEVTEHVSVSCTGAQFPALTKSESTLEILYSREDSVSREQSKILPCGPPSRTFESQHSLKTSSLSQSKTDNSEHLQLLKELQLKIAGKLLRSQIPHNVPPPLESGLVLKYPICLECGRCSGFNCCHKLQSTFGPYLLIYPQLHLLNTPEGHGDVRLHLGFKLAYPWKGAASPSHRKGRFSTPASKRPDYESNQDETWVKSRLRKTSVLTDSLKKMAKGPKTPNTRLYKISPRTLRGLSRNGLETTQTSTVSSKTQTKKSSQPKIIQPLFQGLRQAFQAAHRIASSTGQKLKEKIRPDNLCSVKNLHPNQRAKDYCFMGDSEGSRTPDVRLRSTSSNPKQKDTWQGGSERGRQAPRPKHVSSLLPRPLPLQKTMVCGRDVFKKAISLPEIVQNVYENPM
ncbi:hypothetical protein APTSU1_001256800 [Apodemus speciosus]|uniref:Uncharacterized protein n=1 Tax=Apodemus speciosus TaxID=105296 RepID=A0ABQ0FDK9_APOSI